MPTISSTAQHQIGEVHEQPGLVEKTLNSVKDTGVALKESAENIVQAVYSAVHPKEENIPSEAELPPSQNISAEGDSDAHHDICKGATVLDKPL